MAYNFNKMCITKYATKILFMVLWCYRNPSDRKYSHQENGWIAITKTARARRLVLESYRYLSRRNPQSSQCLLVKWVNKSSSVIHLNHSRRNCCNAKNDPGSKEQAPRMPPRDLNSSDEGLSACIGQRAKTLFLSSVLVRFPPSEMRKMREISHVKKNRQMPGGISCIGSG